jgi:hypothetical protein
MDLEDLKRALGVLSTMWKQRFPELSAANVEDHTIDTDWSGHATLVWTGDAAKERRPIRLVVAHQVTPQGEHPESPSAPFYLQVEGATDKYDLTPDGRPWSASQCTAPMPGVPVLERVMARIKDDILAASKKTP